MSEFEIHTVWPTPGRIVVVERRQPNAVPEYIVHGETQCRGCDHWCWLGSETMKLVLKGLQAVCVECASTSAQAGELGGPYHRVVDQ